MAVKSPVFIDRSSIRPSEGFVDTELEFVRMALGILFADGAATGLRVTHW
jgi:hypothetical protein